MSRLDDLVTELDQGRRELEEAREELEYHSGHFSDCEDAVIRLEREIGKLSMFDEKTTMRVLARSES